MTAAADRLPYDYAVASRARSGARQSGDAALVQATRGGVLVAVADGLGHGAEAAAAAAAALAVVREYAAEPLPALLQRCHAALASTRGVALALAAIDSAGATLTWTGVGNVEAVLMASAQGPRRDRQALTNSGGVVGYRLPPVQARTVPLYPGDLLMLATDGIDERFVPQVMPDGALDGLARAILDRHGKASDDALVLLLRWRGRAAADSSPSPP